MRRNPVDSISQMCPGLRADAHFEGRADWEDPPPAVVPTNLAVEGRVTPAEGFAPSLPPREVAEQAFRPWSGRRWHQLEDREFPVSSARLSRSMKISRGVECHRADRGRAIRLVEGANDAFARTFPTISAALIGACDLG